MLLKLKMKNKYSLPLVTENACHRLFRIMTYFCNNIWTSVQSNLANGHIAYLSHLAAANGFVHPRSPSNTWFLGPTWVSPQMASRSFQPFVCSTPVWPNRQLVTPRGCTQIRPRPQESATRSVQQFLHSTSMWPTQWIHRHVTALAIGHSN